MSKYVASFYGPNFRGHPFYYNFRKSTFRALGEGGGDQCTLPVF